MASLETCAVNRTRNETGRDILLAVGLSLLAVACFLCVLTPLFLFDELIGDGVAPDCNISGCHLIEDGRLAAVTYWTPSRRASRAPRHHVTTVDLQADELHGQDHRLCPHIWAAATAFPGRQMLAIDLKGNVTRIPLKRHKPGNTYPAVFGRSAPARLQSIDDRLFAAQAGTQILVCDLEREKLLWRYSDLTVTCFVAVPARKSVIVLFEGGQLMELDGRTGRPVRAATQLSSTGYTAAISRDGRRLAVLLGWEGARVLELPTETGPWTDLNPDKPGITGFGNSLALSPSGDVLVTSPERNAGTLAVWSVSTRRCIHRLEMNGQPFQGAAFANEHTLISWAHGGTLNRWDFRRGRVDAWTPELPVEPANTWWSLFAQVL